MQFLHLLGIILCLVTLIGALGGSLRFQENFYEEVFDLVDSEEGFEEMAEGEKNAGASEPEPEIQGMDESLITQAEVEQPGEKAEPVVAAPEVEEEAVEVEAYDQEEVFATI